MTEHNKRLPHPRASWFLPETGALIEHASLMKRMAEKDVVLLGETHNVAEIHRWQLHTAAALYLLRPDMMMGFEMFPARLQPVLDDWVEGKFDTETFLRESEWYEVWGFPAELYLPLFHFCRQHRIRMLALNCYRALVTRVGVEGWENVPESERDGLTPAAPASAEYRL
ncbi:MAG: ChaN family lipoprotein, partial [Candidatus Accumulibacter sp.]|nr:ChaN family lipoprotein [Accumulibacter sp.]